MQRQDNITIRIGCVDPRVNKDGVYYFSTAGVQVYSELIQNMQVILKLASRLELVGHFDCRAHKIRAGYTFNEEISSEILDKIKENSLKDLDLNFQKLLDHPIIRENIKDGLKIVKGFDDLEKVEFK